ncbi:MAG: hypothetical protein CMJ46_00750, partial [Planctomyces sp.]|nr:hypothetical protein [Planctomyces sp.]
MTAGQNGVDAGYDSGLPAPSTTHFTGTTMQALRFCLTIIVGFALLCCTPRFCVSAEDTNAVDNSSLPPDLVVYGGTPGGIACAVRAAREGLQVELISPWPQLGGMFSNGLSTMDTLYNGSRSPLYDEFRASIYDYYRQQYGPDSPQYRATQPDFAKTRYEAHVAEELLEQMLAAESRIHIRRGWYPIAAQREGRRIVNVTFKQPDGAITTIAAPVFADCSYEGDLLAVAKVPYRVGREARSEFNEPHAGIIYVDERKWPPPDVDARHWQLARKLNLVQYDTWYPIRAAESTGEA